MAEHNPSTAQDPDSADELHPGPRYHVQCSCGWRSRSMEYWAALMACHVHIATPRLAPFSAARRAEGLQNGCTLEH